VNSKQSVTKRILEDWGAKPQSKICLAVLDYLLRVPLNDVCHITYGSLRQVIGQEYTDIELLKSVQYLCGDRANLLEIGFELIDSNDEIYELSNSDVNLAKKTGDLIHPETGEYVKNFEEKVHIYFKPSPLIASLTKLRC
jgi:polyphosphate kinase